MNEENTIQAEWEEFNLQCALGTLQDYGMTKKQLQALCDAMIDEKEEFGSEATDE